MDPELIRTYSFHVGHRWCSSWREADYYRLIVSQLPSIILVFLFVFILYISLVYPFFLLVFYYYKHFFHLVKPFSPSFSLILFHFIFFFIYIYSISSLWLSFPSSVCSWSSLLLVFFSFPLFFFQFPRFLFLNFFFQFPHLE